MKKYTNEEAKALRGTEFIYVFKDGDTIPAFIAEVDLKKGLTLKALEQFTTRDQYQLWDDSDIKYNPENYDNVSCIVVGETPNALEKIQKRLNDIVNTGYYKGEGVMFGIMRTCAF